MFQMIVVEHQPQNVITTLSVRLAAQYAQHEQIVKDEAIGVCVCVCLYCGLDAATLCSFFTVFPTLFRDGFFFSSAIQVSDLLSMPNRLPLLCGGFFAYY